LKDKDLETIIFLARLSPQKCNLRKNKSCSSYLTPCCLFCRYLATCYKGQREKNVTCKFSRKIGFCAKIEAQLRRLERKRNESMAK